MVLLAQVSVGTRAVASSLQVQGGAVDLGELRLDAKDFDNERATAVVAVRDAQLSFHYGRFYVRQVSTPPVAGLTAPADGCQ